MVGRAANRVQQKYDGKDDCHADTKPALGPLAHFPLGMLGIIFEKNDCLLDRGLLRQRTMEGPATVVVLTGRMLAMPCTIFSAASNIKRRDQKPPSANSAFGLYFREEVSLMVLAFRFAQTDPRPATVFCDEFDACLF
jgi:hypothetical protein